MNVNSSLQMHLYAGHNYRTTLANIHPLMLELRWGHVLGIQVVWGMRRVCILKYTCKYIFDKNAIVLHGVNVNA